MRDRRTRAENIPHILDDSDDDRSGEDDDGLALVSENDEGTEGSEGEDEYFGFRRVMGLAKNEVPETRDRCLEVLDRGSIEGMDDGSSTFRRKVEQRGVRVEHPGSHGVPARAEEQIAV